MSNMDGFTCKNKKDVTVLRSDDGYYTGTMEDIGPFCRVSKQYYNHEDGAQKALDNGADIGRDCVENNLCSESEGCNNMNNGIKKIVKGMESLNNRESRIINYKKQRFSIHFSKDGSKSISTLHPYDDADYHYAFLIKDNQWGIYKSGKLVKKVTADTDEEILDTLISMDSKISPRMVHN